MHPLQSHHSSHLETVLQLLGALSGMQHQSTEDDALRQHIAAQSAQEGRSAQMFGPQLQQAQSQAGNAPLERQIAQQRLSQLQYENSPEIRGLNTQMMQGKAQEPENERIGRMAYAALMAGDTRAAHALMIRNNFLQPSDLAEPETPEQAYVRQRLLQQKPQPGAR